VPLAEPKEAVRSPPLSTVALTAMPPYVTALLPVAVPVSVPPGHGRGRRRRLEGNESAAVAVVGDGKLARYVLADQRDVGGVDASVTVSVPLRKLLS
jgi:hypothetical protein